MIKIIASMPHPMHAMRVKMITIMNRLTTMIEMKKLTIKGRLSEKVKILACRFQLAYS